MSSTTDVTEHRLPSARRRLVRSAAVAVLMVLAYAAAPTPQTVHAAAVTFVIFLAAFAGLAAYLVVLLRWRRGSGSYDIGTIIESMALVVLATVLVFALIYLRLAQTPGQFESLSTHADALYFTMATVTTVGYGDVHAVGQAARIVVTAQLVLDVLLVGGLVRIAATLVAAKRPTGPADPSSSRTDG